MNRSVTAGPATIGAALERIKRVRSRGFVFVDHRINEEALSFADLYSASSRMGRCLLARGLFPGDRVALIIPEAKEFVLAFLGAISAGLIPVPLFPPLTGKLRIHEERTAAILSSCEARCILLPHALLASLPRLAKAACDRGAVALEALASDDPGRDPAPGRQPARPQDPCFLQYTSGSTGDPKGVIVTHHNLVANIEAIAKAVQLRPGREVCVSWLPLCHDMGLIGFVLLPLVLQCRAVFIPTLGFMTRPASWMKTVHLHRGTATFAPNFAFDLAARRAKGIETLDLSCLRVLGCGAEPIRFETLQRFVDAFAHAGLQADAIVPSYGLAECTLAVSMARGLHTASSSPPNEPRGTHRMQAVSCGTSLPGHEVSIVDPAGAPCPDGQIGEIAVRGPSVTPGYFFRGRTVPHALCRGRLRTRDLGFMTRGEVFVCARQKDLIIIAGRNHTPQTFEWSAERLPEVRAGGAAAFSVPGDVTEQLVIVVETRSKDAVRLALEIEQTVATETGIRPVDVVLVRPAEIARTSSGKVQRRRMRQWYLDHHTTFKQGTERHVTRRTLVRGQDTRSHSQ